MSKIAAILTPLNGKSDADVIKWLSSKGVNDVQKLAEGFISVKATSKILEDAKSVANVEIKVKSKMHNYHEEAMNSDRNVDLQDDPAIISQAPLRTRQPNQEPPKLGSPGRKREFDDNGVRIDYSKLP